VIAAQSGEEILVELPIAVTLGDAPGIQQDARKLGSFFQPIRRLADRKPERLIGKASDA
jgi:hypothetical protein